MSFSTTKIILKHFCDLTAVGPNGVPIFGNDCSDDIKELRPERVGFDSPLATEVGTPIGMPEKQSNSSISEEKHVL